MTVPKYLIDHFVKILMDVESGKIEHDEGKEQLGFVLNEYVEPAGQ